MVIVFDLDDTLYDEIDFVKSGFKEISKYLKNNVYYNFMLDIFYQEGSGTVFNALIDKYNIQTPLQKLIEIYRFHTPTLSLSRETIELLEFAQKFQTALISDGHYIMQQNKFNALKLHKYIEYPIFTDFYHTKKPNLKPYQMIMEYYKGKDTFIYISDNPKKDFFAVQELNWTGIRYKNPLGIYKNFENTTNYEVEKRSDVINVLLKIADKNL
jgi:putative hydrolase of the HAD superfamily